jgi:hypothetical protein
MPLPSSLALTTIPDGSTIVADAHRNNYTAIQTNVNQTLGVLGGVWTAYTPVWTTTGTAPALGNGQLFGKFFQFGKYVTAHMIFVAGTTTTFGTGEYRFSLPVTAGGVGGSSAIGSGYVFDASANQIWTVVAVLPATTFVSAYFTAPALTNFVVNAAGPFTWATTDSLQLSVTYEAA